MEAARENWDLGTMSRQGRQLTAKDPIRFGGGLNLYAYVGNDPVNLIDPSGLYFPLWEAIFPSAPDPADYGASSNFPRGLEFVPDPIEPLVLTGVVLTPGSLPGGGVFGGGARLLGAALEEEQIGLLVCRGTNRIPWDSPSRIGHIFRAAPGHVSARSAAARGSWGGLFEAVANNPNNLVYTANAAARQAGVEVYQWESYGYQVWVKARQGVIYDAGVNLPGFLR